MPTSFVVIDQSANRLIVDVTSTDNDDASIVIPHGMGSVSVPKIPQVAHADALLPEFYAAEWRLTARGATNVTFTRTVGAPNSANAAPQMRVTIKLPHSVNG